MPISARTYMYQYCIPLYCSIGPGNYGTRAHDKQRRTPLVYRINKPNLFSSFFSRFVYRDLYILYGFSMNFRQNQTPRIRQSLLTSSQLCSSLKRVNTLCSITTPHLRIYNLNSRALHNCTGSTFKYLRRQYTC
jgi:hypothetical protein